MLFVNNGLDEIVNKKHTNNVSLTPDFRRIMRKCTHSPPFL
jgi:hypothetical protein